MSKLTSTPLEYQFVYQRQKIEVETSFDFLWVSLKKTREKLSNKLEKPSIIKALFLLKGSYDTDHLINNIEILTVKAQLNCSHHIILSNEFHYSFEFYFIFIYHHRQALDSFTKSQNYIMLESRGSMFGDGVVKYLYIANDLKQQIKNGEYKFGEAIPSENELTKVFDVSRHTIREAVSLLVKDKFVRKEKGSGTYVSYDATVDQELMERPLIVGVITTYMSDYIFPSIIRGIEGELNKENIGLLISSTHNNYEDEKNALRKMMNSNVDGLIIEPTKSSYFNPNTNLYLELNARGIPFIMINSIYSEFDANFVAVDDEKSGYIATEHLIENGHSKILAIMKIDDKQGNNRLKGFVKAYAYHKLSSSNDSILTYETEDKINLAEKLDKIDFDNFTAVICYNDEVALQVSSYLKDKGYDIPNDISIVSHDNSILSDNSMPKITSISHPMEELGVEAAKWIISAIKGKIIKTKHKLFDTHLVKKDSVKNIEINKDE